MIKEFEIRCAKTINLGNFQSIRVEASLVVCVPDGDDYAALTRKAQEDLRELLDQTYKAQKRGET